MMRSFALIWILGITLVSSQKSPTISSITQKPIKHLGERATLSCEAQYASTFSVLWMKLGRNRNAEPTILTSGDTKIIDNPRFSSQHDSDSSTYSLQIDDLQETDDGFYRCEMIIDLYNKISAEVELAVIHPAFIYDNSSRSTVVLEGQNVHLECYAGGFPVPKVYWRRRDNTLLLTGKLIHKGNILEIPLIKKHHRGAYYCIAENGVGRSVRRSISVEVLFAPVVTAPSPSIGQALRNDVDLSCHIEAYPQPAIVWLIRGEAIPFNRHYSVSQVSEIDDITDTSLSIKSIEFRQFGVYTCRAINAYGSAEATVELYETPFVWGKSEGVKDEETITQE